MDFHHETVLQAEVVSALEPWRGGVYIDATLGGGGHTHALFEAAEQVGAWIEVIGFDRDADALQSARDRLAPFSAQLRTIQDNYRNVAQHIEALGLSHQIQGVVLDAGVSSYQLDTAHRGFSFLREGPLDMRMDSTQGETAAQLLDRVDETELARILGRYGEVPSARRVARAILVAHGEKPLETTLELADLCERIPALRSKPKRRNPKKRTKHAATQVFQALRIAVNDELTSLEEALLSIPHILQKGGRAAVISFHSLEDRIVKQTFRNLCKGPLDDLPSAIPILPEDLPPAPFAPWGKPQTPSQEELASNTRSRSSRLRCIERVLAPE